MIERAVQGNSSIYAQRQAMAIAWLYGYELRL